MAGCGRCRSDVEHSRTHRVEYTLLNGLDQRKQLCKSCLRALDDFLRGRGV